MLKSEFQKSIADLVSCFGEKSFPPAKVARIWEHVQKLNKTQFGFICTKFIDEDKRPGVSDFRAAAKAYSGFQIRPEVKEEFCFDCSAMGLVQVRIEGKQPLLRCHCEAGKKCPWNLPGYKADLVIVPWDEMSFRPKMKMGAPISFGQLWENFEELKTRIMTSQAFWFERRYDPPTIDESGIPILQNFTAKRGSHGS